MVVQIITINKLFVWALFVKNYAMLTTPVLGFCGEIDLKKLKIDQQEVRALSFVLLKQCYMP